MIAVPFSPEELEELRRADAEIEAEFDGLTEEEIREARLLDSVALKESARNRAERQRVYYAANREAVLERNRRWQLANQDKSRAIQKAYRERHREELLQKQHAYYDAHRDEINARRRAKRKASRESSVVSRENVEADAPGGPRKEVKT